MPDKYPNFAALAMAESPSAYAIRLRSSGSKVVFVAPHSGGIEPGTSEIALALAGEDCSWYSFDGNKNSSNSDLHITSTNFDEPQCLDLIARSEVVVTIHGEASEDRVVFIGGLHRALMDATRWALSAASYNVAIHSKPHLQGLDRTNIANRGSSGAGVQLELSRGLRQTFFTSLDRAGRTRSTESLGQFVLAVRSAINVSGLMART